MMRLDLATEAFIGARAQQQDAAGAYGFGTAGGAVLVLADGLGGHSGGAEASHIVREAFREAATTGAFDKASARHQALRDALEQANLRIADGADPNHGQRGMASTAVAALVVDGTISWISVGDSHLYVWRKGHLAKLNEDHSQAGIMVRSGQFKETDPEVLAAKSILVSALTGRKMEIVDHPAKPMPLEPGDIILLASDGLNTLNSPEIQDLVAAAIETDATSQEISDQLIAAVRDCRADRQDNTAVVVARVIGLPSDSLEAHRDEIIVPTQITAPTEVSPSAATHRVDDDPVSLAAREPTPVKTPAQPAVVAPARPPSESGVKSGAPSAVPAKAPAAKAGATPRPNVVREFTSPATSPLPAAKARPRSAMPILLLVATGLLLAAAAYYALQLLPRQEGPETPPAAVPTKAAAPATTSPAAPAAAPAAPATPATPQPATPPAPAAQPAAAPQALPVPPVPVPAERPSPAGQGPTLSPGAGVPPAVTPAPKQ